MTEQTNGYRKNDNGRADADFEEIKIPVPWGHVSGKWWGSKDRQPILAVHGWQDNAGTFDNLAPLLLTDNLSLLCIDLPGHGYSSHYPKGAYYYIFWDGIHLLRRIIKHFLWNDVVLLGHSLGGGMAFLYASVFPNEIKKYVSIDIACPPIRDASRYDVLASSVDKFLSYENSSDEKIPSYTYNEMLDLIKQAYGDSASRDSCEILMQRGMVPSKNGGYHFSRDLRLKVCALGFFSLEQVLQFASRVKCEVLNIRGSPGLSFDRPEYYDMVLNEIKKSASKLERHVVPGAHHLHLDNAESVAGIISDFINS